MNSICEPSNYEVIALTTERVGRGRYRVHAHHRHEGSKSYCPNNELYDDLAWDEALDVIVMCADGRRPGMHPAGWEQESLFDA